jgi:hypothetical protein
VMNPDPEEPVTLMLVVAVRAIEDPVGVQAEEKDHLPGTVVLAGVTPNLMTPEPAA